MTTATRKATKTVQVIARIQFKSDARKVVYKVCASNGVDMYETYMFDGKATSCTCPAHKPCYHMVQLEAKEAERANRLAMQEWINTPETDGPGLEDEVIDLEEKAAILAEANSLIAEVVLQRAELVVGAQAYIGLDGKKYAWNEEMEPPFEDLDEDALYDARKRAEGLDVPLTREQYVACFDPDGMR